MKLRVRNQEAGSCSAECREFDCFYAGRHTVNTLLREIKELGIEGSREIELEKMKNGKSSEPDRIEDCS